MHENEIRRAGGLLPAWQVAVGVCNRLLNDLGIPELSGDGDRGEIESLTARLTAAKEQASPVTLKAPMPGRTEPGSPCPMCPTVVRNLAAQARNLTLRLKAPVYEFIDVGDRLVGLREVLPQVDLILTMSDPFELRNLRNVCQRFVSVQTWSQLFDLRPELEAAVDAVDPLMAAHFANPKHAYPH